MEHSNGFTYWKRPWYQWLILAAAILQLLCLWMNLQEYHDLSAVGILTGSAWADYAAQKRSQCALNGLLAACFSGHFLIGICAHSPKAARLAEGIFAAPGPCVGCGGSCIAAVFAERKRRLGRPDPGLGPGRSCLQSFEIPKKPLSARHSAPQRRPFQSFTTSTTVSVSPSIVKRTSSPSKLNP